MRPALILFNLRCRIDFMHVSKSGAVPLTFFGLKYLIGLKADDERVITTLWTFLIVL